MNINYELYKVFMSVATLGSMSKAAQELMITPSSVSQSLKNLEHELNTTLFYREQKGSVLTSDGKQLYELLLKPYSALNSVEQKFRTKPESANRVFKIGASNALTQYVLFPKLNQILKQKCAIEVDNHMSQKDMIIGLEEGYYDAVIVKDYNQPKKDFLKQVKIGELNYVLFYSSKTQKISNSNYTQFPLIIKSVGSKLLKQNETIIKDVLEKFSQTIKVGYDELIVEAVRNGLGVGFAPKEYLSNEFITIENTKTIKVKILLLYKEKNELVKALLE